MLRARRLASAVVAASLAVGGLSACRSEPSVAAYIGAEGRVSEQRVQEIWDEVHDGLSTLAERQAAQGEAAQPETGPAEVPPPGPVRMPISRADVVRAVVGQQVYSKMAEERRLQLPSGVPYDEIAGQFGVPADSEYARLATQIAVYRQLLGQAITAPGRPSEGDLRMVYDRLAAAGGVEPGQDFADWSSSVSPENLEAVARAGAIRAEVEKVVQAMDIDVNPRYHPFEFDLLSTETENGALNLLGAAVGEDLSAPVDDAPVVDAS